MLRSHPFYPSLSLGRQRRAPGARHTSDARNEEEVRTGCFKQGGVGDGDRPALFEADCPASREAPRSGTHGGKESRWTLGSFLQTAGAVHS